ncbi:hypothetical protein [Apilactobacillus micheneri]|uniref:hypothetical protein n=1 Tax=Apilactobacillus micheneri TaxID=1899430 RepID=UPI0011288264|nr:hypothetical protein [Apilactobacillus micheneri]TPR50748.1 hypothetical protein DY126_06785 [Apilactobacillus micheneri]
MYKNYVSSNQYIKTVELNNKKFTSLDDLDNIQKEYSKGIRVKQALNIDLSKPENRLYSRWSVNSNERFTIKSNMDGQKIVFERWLADMEHQIRNIYSDDNHTKILSKEKRTKNYYTNVLFFSKNNKVYACILAKDKNIVNNVMSLINLTNINLSSSPLSTDERIIEWIFWRGMTNKKLMEPSDSSFDERVEIDNLYSFKGNDELGNGDDLISGKSPQVTDLDVTKAVLSLNDPLNAAMIALNWKGSELKFVYSMNGSVIISMNNSFLNSDISMQSTKNKYVDTYEKIIYIVALIIPKLLDLFNSDSQKFITDFDEFKQTSAKYLIKKLMNVNNIDINDIK